QHPLGAIAPITQCDIARAVVVHCVIVLVPVQAHERAIAIRRGQAGERLTDGRILCRNAIGIPANVAVFVPVEGDALVGTSGTLQHSDDLALLVSVDDTINDKALLAVLEIGLVLKDKAQVVAALSLAMT